DLREEILSTAAAPAPVEAVPPPAAAPLLLLEPLIQLVLALLLLLLRPRHHLPPQKPQQHLRRGPARERPEAIVLLVVGVVRDRLHHDRPDPLPLGLVPDRR